MLLGSRTPVPAAVTSSELLLAAGAASGKAASPLLLLLRITGFRLAGTPALTLRLSCALAGRCAVSLPVVVGRAGGFADDGRAAAAPPLGFFITGSVNRNCWRLSTLPDASRTSTVVTMRRSSSDGSANDSSDRDLSAAG